MVSTFISLLDIQSWWEIPCIAHFCSLFSSTFKLPDIDIEDLETALLNDGTEETVGLLPELIVRLLKGCDNLKNRKEITTSNYQMFLRRFLREQCRRYQTENYFDSDIDFQSLPLRKKLLVLHSLCHFRLESKDVESILNKLEADSLRIEPLGYDSKNSRYWYFFGTRLYREDTKHGSKPRIWQVVCFTEDDWNNLAAKLKDSTCSKERALYNILVQNFIPKLPHLFRERERLRRRKLFQVRCSVRIKNLVQEKKEEAEKKNLESDTVENKSHAVNSLRSRTRRRSQSISSNSVISSHIAFCDNRKKQNLNNFKSNYVSANTDSEEEESSKYSCKSFESDKKPFDKINLPSVIQLTRHENKENYTELKIKSNRNFVGKIDFSKKNKMAPTTNTKLPGRQTNNSLSTLSGNIFIPPVLFNPSSENEENEKIVCLPNAENLREQDSSQSSSESLESLTKRKKLKLSTLFTETEEVLQIGMHKVLVNVKNHQDAWPFMDPVEEDIAPRYYTIIRRPMDLLKMEEKLENGEYKKFSDFRNDFKLIVNNCRLYNGQNNEYTDMVNNLQDAFDKATNKYFDQNSSDEETNLEYPDDKTNIFREKNFNKGSNNRVFKEGVKKSKGKKGKHLLLSKNFSKVAHSINELPDIICKHKTNESLEKFKKRDKEKHRRKKSKHYELSPEISKQILESSTMEDEVCLVQDSLAINPIKSFSIKTEHLKLKQIGNKENKFSENSRDLRRTQLRELIPDENPEQIEASASLSKGQHVPLKDADRRIEGIKLKTIKKGSKTQICQKYMKHRIITGAKEKDRLMKETPETRVKLRASGNDVPSKLTTNKSSHSNKNKKCKLRCGTTKRMGKKRNLNAKKHRKYSNFGNIPDVTESLIVQNVETDNMVKENSFINNVTRKSSTLQTGLKCTNIKLSKGVEPDHVLEVHKEKTIATPFMDKYDLIKQRRNRNIEGKSNQLHKQSKYCKKDTKNLKNEDESENSKSSKKTKNPKTKICLKIVEEINKSKFNTNSSTNGKTMENKEKNSLLDDSRFSEKRDVQCTDEYAFVSDPTEGNSQQVHQTETTVSKTRDTKKSMKKIKSGFIDKKGTNKTNMEALELETEQTLKDINRWLEHTPRFSEFSSASNSPSRYNLLDDFDTVASKLDSSDFRRPVQISPGKHEIETKASETFDDMIDSKRALEITFETSECTINNDTKGVSTNLSNAIVTTSKNQDNVVSLSASQTTFRINPGSKCQQREIKRKIPKEKVSATVKRKDILRTIDRLQPGKSKGNLISNMHTPSKHEELMNITTKKEVKNSLVVNTSANGPKLSLGSVLNTSGFGFGQLHNFESEETSDDTKDCNKNELDKNDVIDKKESNTFNIKETTKKIEMVLSPVDEEQETKVENRNEKSTTPNLSAWFKAFGLPKKTRKIDEESSKIEVEESNQVDRESGNLEVLNGKHSMGATKSPSNNEVSSIPTVRQRKASTGSTISERSSFSQDPDSPRIGVDERFGMYSGSCASPLGASPIMVSPKPEENSRTNLCPLNGAIKVGFYQDTTSKSSPEKICSPREASSYSRFSNTYPCESIESAESKVENIYRSFEMSEEEKPNYTLNNNRSIYEQYKQSQTQYNSLNSNTCSDANYQNQSSPYEHSEASPYESSPNSPYDTHSTIIASNNTSSSRSNDSPLNNSSLESKETQESHSQYGQPNCSSTYQQSYQNSSSYEQVEYNSQQVELRPPVNSNGFGTPAAQQYNLHNESTTYINHEELLKTNIDNVTKETNEWRTRIHDVEVSENLGHRNTSCNESDNVSLGSLNNPHLQRDSLNIKRIQLTDKSDLSYVHYSEYATQKLNIKPQAPTLYNTNIASGHQEILDKCDQSPNRKSSGDEQAMINMHFNNNDIDKIPKVTADLKTFEMKQQQMFESFLGSMNNNGKESIYNKQTDINNQKTFGEYGRSLVIGCSKEFVSNVDSVKVNTIQESPQSQVTYANANVKNLSLEEIRRSSGNKSVGLIKDNFGSLNVESSPNTRKTEEFQVISMSKFNSTDFQPSLYAERSKQHDDQNIHFQESIIDGNKLPNDATVPTSRQGSLAQALRTHQINMDLTNYKPTFNNPTSILDPLRTLNHPLSMIDESILNVSNSSSSGYYEKTIPPAHMYNKTLPQSVFPPHYNNREQQTIMQHSAPFLPSQPPTNTLRTENVETENPKTLKKTRRKKNNLIPSGDLPINQNHSSLLQTHANIAIQNHTNQQQGFQLYTGLKTTNISNNSNNLTASNDSMKNSSTMVPGSAFNFGPPPNAIGLSTSIYGENPSYLEEFRPASNPYYISPNNRTGTNASIAEKSTVNSAASSPYHQFLQHGPSRPSYPFINSQLEPSSPLYQQYLQRQQDDFRARMMGLNPSLLSSGESTGYSQPGYRPPISMTKHYDLNTMNRQSWF